MTKLEAVAQIKLLVPSLNLDPDDLDALAMCSDAELERAVRGWKLIGQINSETTFQKIGDVLASVAEWAPLALKVAAIAVVVL